MTEQEMRNTFSKNLRRILENKGLSQIDVADAMNVSKSTVSSWCVGTKMPRMGKIDALTNLLCVNRSDLLEDKSIPQGFDYLPSTKAVPRVGQIACGQPVLAESHITGYDEVPARWRADFTLLCKGDSMAPKINDGDLVAIRKQETVEQGQIAAVRIGTEATLKMVFIHDDFVELRAVNPDYPSIIKAKDSMDGIAIEGLAVGFWREI